VQKGFQVENREMEMQNIQRTDLAQTQLPLETPFRFPRQYDFLSVNRVSQSIQEIINKTIVDDECFSYYYH